MNGEIYQITPAQMEALLGAFELSEAEKATLLSSGAISEDLLVGMYDSKPLCFLGFVPLTLISDHAYLWLWPATIEKKVMFGRHSVKVMKKAIEKYSVIQGHCMSNQAYRWLQWLGAEFDPHSTPPTFEFRRPA